VRASVAAIALLMSLAGAAMLSDAFAATCGGAVVCQCGDTVVEDYTMTSDLGPCPLVLGGDTIGLRVGSGVNLNCADHAIVGPPDSRRSEFGIRVGTSSAPVSDVVIRNCRVTDFWWGIYVQSASNVVIKKNHIHENGWKDNTENGTGYGIDIANSTGVSVRYNTIVDNGDEGIHLSDSTAVTVTNNLLKDNGKEQLYLLRANGNFISHNRTEGGNQGLEMRFSSNNTFAYNVWAPSPLHMLDNDNHDNTFFYDRFEGRVFVGNTSLRNRFELSEFINPAGNCLSVDTDNETYVYKGFFRSCLWDVFLVTSAPVTLDRSVVNLAKVSKGVAIQFPGCTADFDLDANVTPAERSVVEAAQGSVIGNAHWNPEADLDHDGDVDAADLAVFNSQVGPCAPNLVVTALTNPPSAVTPGTAFTVTDTVQNQSRIPAVWSRTQYYLSLDGSKGSGDKLLGGRVVPALGDDGMFTASLPLLIPTSTALGTYFLLTCADDTQLVTETEEANCRASTTTVQVGRPDLTTSAVTSPPSAAIPGFTFPVTDTVRNQTAFPAGASRTQYYLSADGVKNTGDRPLSGARAVPALAAGGLSTATINVTIPGGTPFGTYFLLACADDAAAVVETDNLNNCRPSTTPVEVGRPDLTTTTLSEPPPSAIRGSSISVTDTGLNQSAFNVTGTFRVQYYLSLDGLKNAGDRLLTGFRTVAGLAPFTPSTATTVVTIPAATPAGDYFLLACVDDTSVVIESVETNNCRASTNKVRVTP